MYLSLLHIQLPRFVRGAFATCNSQYSLFFFFRSNAAARRSEKIIKKATNGQDMMSNHPSHLRLTSLTCSDSGTRRTTSGTENLMY